MRIECDLYLIEIWYSLTDSGRVGGIGRLSCSSLFAVDLSIDPALRGLWDNDWKPFVWEGSVNVDKGSSEEWCKEFINIELLLFVVVVVLLLCKLSWIVRDGRSLIDGIDINKLDRWLMDTLVRSFCWRSVSRLIRSSMRLRRSSFVDE